MNWGSAATGFTNGFMQGAQLRDRNRQRKLQEAAQEFEKEQQLLAAKLREEQFAFDRSKFDRQMDLQTRAFDEQLADNAFGREFKIGQANRADALNQERLKLDQQEAAAKAKALETANHWRAYGQIMGNYQDAMNAYNAKPKINAEIERMQAQSAALLAKANGLAGGGSGGEPAAQMDPQAQVYQQAIDAERRKVAEHEMAMAGGDNRTGLFNWKSRQSEIDDANAKIAKIQQLMGGQPGAAMPTPAAAMPGAQTGMAGPGAAPQPKVGTIVMQAGKRYRFDGQRWAPIQ